MNIVNINNYNKLFKYNLKWEISCMIGILLPVERSSTNRQTDRMTEIAILRLNHPEDLRAS